MLERTTRHYFEDVISEDFNYLQANIVETERKKQSTRTRGKQNSPITKESNDFSPAEHIMTRKTRTRRPRISALQPGYCAVCNTPYNSVEDHIQSKKHQKLIGEDANYIALNGSINGFLQTNSIPFLNLNGIDAIGVHDTSLDDFSSEYKKRAMRRNRAVSVIFDRGINPSPLSPTGSDTTGHHLRSRRNINYMIPPLEDDSLHEKPDFTVKDDHEQENKDSRELRSTTRSLAKLMLPQPEEVWNSGRPKRACISKKRLSVDDRLTNCKAYYKVEVLTTKPKPPATKNQETTKRQQSQSPKREEDKDKGLIVKFKKLRNSELVQLNNEATNFLFPKKEDTSEEEQEDEGDCNTTASSVDSSSNLEMDDCKSSTPRVKNEDDGSRDSMGKKKKRRTHAEAFIMDNQRYYKFETPGSRLRYQGSYLPMVPRSPERPTKMEEELKFDEPPEKKVKKYDAKVTLDNYKFAFEKVPTKTGWYNAFRRLDKCEQSYTFFSNYLWESFLLPYQMRSIPPLDRRHCISHYNELLKSLLNLPSGASSRASSAEPSVSASSVSVYEPEQDEDSKLSSTTTYSSDEKPQNVKIGHNKAVKGDRRSGGAEGGKNPRKSPRQHASTLAILSDLVQQRKRRSRKGDEKKLSTIDEEELPVTAQPEEVQEPKREEPIPEPLPSTPAVRACASVPSPLKKPPNKKPPKPKIDYFSIARQIDEELDTAFDENLEQQFDIEFDEENVVEFNKSKITLKDIMALYEENNSKETDKSCRQFFNGTPGRKPGIRRKKLNKTGWPNKSKRQTVKKESNKEKNGDEESIVDSASVHNGSEVEDEEEEEGEAVEETKEAAEEKKEEEKPKRNVGKQKVNNAKNSARTLSDNPKHRVMKRQINKQKLLSDFLQPYVCVQKLDNKKVVKKFSTPKRSNPKRQRRMPGSPKSPRMLRKPRGRWYRER